MKKNILLLFVVASLFACKKDDDTLVGIWGEVERGYPRLFIYEEGNFAIIPYYYVAPFYGTYETRGDMLVLYHEDGRNEVVYKMYKQDERLRLDLQEGAAFMKDFEKLNLSRVRPRNN